MKSPFVQKLAAWLIHKYLRLVWHTCRWEIEGYDAFVKQGGPFIAAFWHGRMAMMGNFHPRYFRNTTYASNRGVFAVLEKARTSMYAYFSALLNPSASLPKRISNNNEHHSENVDERDIYAMVSRHGDGQWIGAVVKRFGLKLVEGSSRRKGSKKERGGAAAFREAVTALKAGNIVAITPDGPRGPIYEIHGNIVNIAQKAGVPVVPLALSFRHAITFNSWDRFQLPLPFTRGIFLVGDALTVPEKASKETLAKLTQKGENALRHVTEEADRRVGYQLPETM